MSKNKKDTKCAVNGSFRFGKLVGICKHIACGESGICYAHGNKKCVHKIKIEQVEGGNR
jgi:hypothetical protein